MTPVVATTSGLLQRAEQACERYAGHLQGTERFLMEMFFRCDWDVHYSELEEAEIMFFGAATLWLLVTYPS